MSAQVSPLKKSADLIRAGKLDKARPLLVEFLRTEPNNAQAWFLLSYTLDDPQRKQYALMQALKADPGFERAENRLRELRGLPPLPPKPDTSTKPLARPVSSSSPAFQPDKAVPAFSAPEPEPDPFRADLVTETPSLEESLRAEQTPVEREAKPRAPLRQLLIGALLVAAFAALFWFSRDFFAGLLANSGAPQATTTERIAAFSTFPPTFTATVPGEEPSPTATQPAGQPEIASLNALTQEDLAQVELIREQASLVRGLSLLDPVEPILVPAEQASSVLSSLAGEPSGSAQRERILRAFGLLGPLDHLDDYELNLLADPYGAVFVADPDRAYLFGTEFNDVLAFAYARMYGLGLVAGNHTEQLQAVAACPLFSDECRAERALVHGDGYLTGEQWLNSYAGAAIFQAVNQVEPNYAWAQSEAPTAFALQDLSFYAENGLEFARSLFAAGGWQQVEAAYAQPPATTEQILHAEKYLAAEAAIDLPARDLAGALGAQWQLQGSGELGEWLTRLLLTAGQNPAARIAAARGAEAAAGWGGDAFQAFWRPSDGQVVLAQLWVMDNEDEAGELVVALQDYVTLRMGGGATQVGLGDCWRALSQQACVYWNGTRVLWLLLPDQQQLLDTVLSAFPEFQG
jgi:hypothetical protein